MPASLGAALGERFVAGGRVYYAALIRSTRRTDALYLDVYIRWVLSRLYFGDARVSDDQLRELARTKWGRYQGYAGFYLATDTDAWANDIGARPLGAGREPRFGAGDHAIAGAS